MRSQIIGRNGDDYEVEDSIRKSFGQSEGSGSASLTSDRESTFGREDMNTSTLADLVIIPLSPHE